MIDFIIFAALGIGGWILSYYSTYHVTLFLYKWLMPIKNRKGEKLSFKIIYSIPFFIGFILDIYFNIVHFSFQLWLMNKKDGLDKKFWPEFKKVTKPKKLYEITLTKRLQKILDEYPAESRAYKYAVEISLILNKYDPDHLKVTR